MKSRHYHKSEATKLIKAITRSGGGRVRITKHSKVRMNERNITMQDILCAFRNGKVIDDSELDIGTNCWKYKMVGNGIDNNDLTITVTINAKEKYVVIITVF